MKILNYCGLESSDPVILHDLHFSSAIGASFAAVSCLRDYRSYFRRQVKDFCELYPDKSDYIKEYMRLR